MKSDIFLNKKFTILALLLLILPIGMVNAAGDTSIVVQPSKIEVTASPGQKLARSFSIINRSNFSVRFKVIVRDYKQISENGQLQFYDATNEPATTWLVPQYLEVGLKPLETKDVGFVVNVPQNFSGGGHYGAILLQSIDNSQNLTANNFGALVLLTVTGSNIKTTAVARTINFWTSGIQSGNPVDFSFKIQNSGNTHFDSTGQLVLKNWLGKTIGTFSVGQLTVYPNTMRDFKWRWNGTPHFGLYRAEIYLSDSSANQNFKLVDGEWFIIFPWQIFLSVLLASAVVFTLVKYRKIIFSRNFSKWVEKETKIRIRDLSEGVSAIVPAPMKNIFKQ